MYAKYDVDVTELEQILKVLSEQWAIKLTLTTLLSWAWARSVDWPKLRSDIANIIDRAVGDNPLANAIVRNGELKPVRSSTRSQHDRSIINNSYHASKRHL